MTHHIQRQYLHADLTGSESEGFALQNRLTEFFSTGLIPALEQVLDAFSVPEQTLVIDRLDIDLGQISQDKLETELPQRLRDELLRCLHSLSPAGSSGQSFQMQNRSSSPKMPDGFSKSQASDEPAVFYRNSLEEHIIVFRFFLENGRLPWYFRLPEGISLEENLAEILISKKEEIQKQPEFRTITNVLRSAETRTRLVLQFSDSFLVLLFHTLSDAAGETFESLLEIAGTPALSEAQKADFRVRLVEAVVETVHENLPIHRSGIAARMLTKPMFENSSESNISEILISRLRALFPEGAPVGQKTQDLISRTPVSESPNPESVSEEIPVRSQTSKPAEFSIGTGEEIYIGNAGMVILHPFLPRFFEETGIATDGVITNPSKALCILHYLATGLTRAPEYELVLPRLLCNIPLHLPVPPVADLSESDLTEAARLLEAVIRHWEALRSTSPDGLRGSFLLRNGKLSVNDEGDWLLQAEPRTWDILLDQLPWGIALIQLPWMPRMLKVEWRT
jgi:hypothetical protein